MSSGRNGGRENVPLDCKVYVGELGNNGTRHELEDAFGYYGPLKEVWVARNPPGFAFVMFQDSRDAHDAVRAMDGKMLCGQRIRVELSTGKSRHEKGRGGGGGGGRGGRGDESHGRSDRESPRTSRRVEPYARNGDSRGSDRFSRRRNSRSRSRSESPIIARGRPRTPPSRSRSRSPIPKSPRPDSRYRYGER